MGRSGTQANKSTERKRLDTEGTVSLQEAPLTYTAIWKIDGDKLVVYFRGKEEAALLGAFANEPETLARMLLKGIEERLDFRQDRKLPSRALWRRPERSDTPLVTTPRRWV